MLVIVLATLQGCATKTYGRQGEVTSFEKNSLSCREIDIEIAKTTGFVTTVNKESEFSGRDVLAILGDFGIGNALERSAAIESANSRLEKLNALRTAKNCGVEAANATPKDAAALNIQASQQATAPILNAANTVPKKE
ncbi:MAG: hypothetical protein AB9900_10900 [Humidesulfovibrio sp.]